MDLLPRLAAPLVRRALSDTPVVVVQGPRQAGKSTLVRSFVGHGHLTDLVTLDDLDVRAAAQADPQGFIAGLGKGAVIDEAQRVPDIVLAIKAAVDRDRQPGRFLLTGSANPFHRQEETLAGRREDVDMWPFVQAELERRSSSLVDDLFDEDPRERLGRATAIGREDVLHRALRGGFPEAVARRQLDRRHAWFRNYVTEVIRSEIAGLASIEGLLDLPKLLRLIAHRNAGLLNVARLARDADLSPQTARRYLALLIETFLVMLIPSWTRSGRKRLVKSPKAVITDSGLMAYLADLSVERLERMPELTGPLLEGFVLTELRRLAGWSVARPTLLHFRTEQGREVDAVLEDRRGRVVGVEVKAGITVTAQDFQSLRTLAEVAGADFHLGIVLHPGRSNVAFGDRLWSVPMSLLWS